MSSNLKIILIVIGLFLLSIILVLVAKKKLPIKYSLFWLLAALVIFLVGLVPEFISIFTRIFGFETTSNLVAGIIILVLLLITMLLTIILAEQKRKVTLLIQEVSILKEKK